MDFCPQRCGTGVGLHLANLDAWGPGVLHCQFPARCFAPPPVTCSLGTSSQALGWLLG